MMQRQVKTAPEFIDVGGAAFPLLLKRHARAKRMTLRYAPLKKAVVLTLPKRASITEALRFLHKSESWLLRQVQKETAAKKIENGALLPVLGEMLTLVHREGERGGVERNGTELWVRGDARFFTRRVTDWLKAELKKEITALAEQKARTIGCKITRIQIREMTSQWGRCTAKGELAFCWRLVFTSREVMEYLVAHEVAHLKEMNHSARFWKVVAELCPHWEEARAWLKREGGDLYRYH